MRDEVQGLGVDSEFRAFQLQQTIQFLLLWVWGSWLRLHVYNLEIQIRGLRHLRFRDLG